MPSRLPANSRPLPADTSPQGPSANGADPTVAGASADSGLEQLADLGLFAGLRRDELADLNKQLTLLHHEPGKVLYAPGEPGDALFLLAQGHVHLYRLSPNGKKLVVARLRPGAFFGALTLLGRETHQSYAQAVDHCTLYRLHRAAATRLLQQKPQVALHLVTALAERLRHLEQHLEAMAFQDMPARLARLLLQLAAEQGHSVVRGYTHHDLADQLGTYRETISGTLNKFRAEGLVRTGRKEIRLENQARLEKIARM